MYSLEGKIALVTGGTAGIGRACAVELAKAGATIVVTGRREQQGEETVQLIKEAGGDGFFTHMDVSNEDDIVRGLDEVISRYGRLDIAVNNAGVAGTGLTTDCQREEYERIFDINVWGVMASMKHEIPLMLKNGSGSIINLASIAGLRGVPALGIYVASKHAVIGATKSAAAEVAAQGIRINAVCPAVIETDMADQLLEEFGEGSDEGLKAAHPMGRFGKASEIAAAVAFLASDKASYMTGETMAVDGGYLI